MQFSTPREMPWTIFCAVQLLLAAILLIFVSGPAPRVGDGSEYFLMTIAIAETGRPWSSPKAEREYSLFRQKQDGSFLTVPELNRFSHDLTLDNQKDFPHFWFYSLLAVPFYLFLQNVSGGEVHCFTLLHLTLMGLLLVVASQQFGRRGIVVASLICLASPVLWFIDKGHTEFFTVTVATVGIIYFLKQKPAYTVLCFCLVSTQNPPFLLVAVLAGLFGLKAKRAELIKQHWPILIAAVLIAALHPVYYWFRHGNITPQLITGAAAEQSKGLRELTCFWVDPDIGLISNWPWVVVPAVCVLTFGVWTRQRPNWSLVAFISLSLLVLCWAQAKTNNFNHGGTIKISRYALWYIPFLFPLLWQFATNYRAVPVWQRIAVFGFLIAALVVNSTKFSPGRGESFLFQTTISEKFYELYPGAYDPVPEIFLERCTRAELPTEAWAVSNRSGSKVIVHSGRLIKQQNRLRKGYPLDPVIGSTRKIDSRKLVTFINRNSDVPTTIDWFYVNRPGDIFENSPSPTN